MKKKVKKKSLTQKLIQNKKNKLTIFSLLAYDTINSTLIFYMFFNQKMRKILLSILFLSIISISFFNINFNQNKAFAIDVDETEKRLRAELQKLEEEEAILQKNLQVQKSKTATIQRDVNILSGQIRQAEINIQKKNLEISKLRDTIDLKKKTVSELDEKLEQSKRVLSELIRKSNETDNISITEIILGSEKLTDFFVDIDSYTHVNNQLQELYDQVKDIKLQTEQEKEELAEKQNEELDAKKEIESQKNVVLTKKTQQDNLLAVSKKSEATYETVIAQKRQQASQIRSALFQLRDSAGIPFGEALEYAQKAQAKTGVRAAFILAILKQESNLGKNVGTCNLQGQPASKKWYSIMPGPTSGSWRDDQTIYKRIVSRLGLEVESMPLSCPWQGGWGGAMGPSQFIPYTWNSYEPKIAQAVGVNIPNPWNPEHAIMATALYVKDLGAAAGGYTAERTAALKYYAGSNWNKPQNAFYGNSVMNHVTGIQTQVDFLAEVE